ncbi:MAG: sugar phosphate isomerase/epimerase [Bacteroides sp.]|nr:sugar phosphate isomerase/epimerase [Bacteroides sp.]
MKGLSISRRRALASLALSSAALSLPLNSIAGTETGKKEKGSPGPSKSPFSFCLNTSTISGQKPSLFEQVKIASEAGYDGIEVWVRDVQAALEDGATEASIKSFINDHGIRVEDAIGFAPWMTGGEAGFRQMEEEMNMLAGIGCLRIAAPPAGVPGDQALDLFMAGEKYAQLLELGRKTGVMPQLEFWGSSPALWHLGQVLMIAAVADDPDARILPDVYHLFRGGSGFDALKMLNGSLIDIFHLNDYPADIPREEQTDADRVYPGDGAAPMKQILSDLKNMGGEKVLSLELFNRSYWEEDPLEVARTGLQKMKQNLLLL